MLFSSFLSNTKLLSHIFTLVIHAKGFSALVTSFTHVTQYIIGTYVSFGRLAALKSHSTQLRIVC